MEQAIEIFSASTIFTAIIIYFLWNGGHIVITNFKSKIKKVFVSHKKKTQLENHPFFLFVNKIILLNEISDWKFKDEFRKLVVTEIIKTKLKVWDKTYRNIISQDYGNLSHEEFKEFILNAVYGVRRDTLKSLRKKHLPELVVEKFSEKTQHISDFYVSSVEAICDSLALEDNHERLHEILNSMKSTAFALTRYTEKTLLELNGELTGLEYKGKIAL